MLVESFDLSQSTTQVFEACAEMYLDEDKHWMSATDFITPFLTDNISIVDIGCGPGWHMRWLSEYRLNQLRLVGVDNCAKMLELAQSSNHSQHSLMAYIHADMRKIPIKSEEFDLALCLNNGLGNLSGRTIINCEAARVLACWEINRILKVGGIAVVSVYNRQYLEHGLEYGSVFNLYEKLSNIAQGDLVIRFTNPPITPIEGLLYYSHWFTEVELRELFKGTGFSPINIETMGPQILITAKKVFFSAPSF